jgi:Mor family transcriptional regulator
MDEIVDVLGVDAALLLCAHFGGCSLYIPSAKSLKLAARDRLIRSDRSAGMLLIELSRKYKLTTRRIIAICKI